MNYVIPYACISHIGRCRRMNQDNFICNGKYMDTEAARPILPGVSEDKERVLNEIEPYIVTGFLTSDQSSLLGVFDGLGGEECGEVASFLAAREASQTPVSGDLKEVLSNLCLCTNARICHYADKHDIQIMGTTAALLAFEAGGMALCNIGDSRIFACSEEGLEQLSEDHLAAVPYGQKAPLTQCLGIPPSEMRIEPYTATRDYREGEMFLLCSDGLTDMVSREDISHVLKNVVFKRKRVGIKEEERILEEAARKLLDLALVNGGHDNVTILLCRIATTKARRRKRNSNFQRKNRTEISYKG